MHLYRYRSPGILSQKGLIYDEWYFASQEELNDPIDMQSKFEFEANSKDKWHRLLSRLWENDPNSSIAADYFSSISPISYEKIIDNFSLHSRFIIERILIKDNFTLEYFKTSNRRINDLKSFLLLYEPTAGYSVSLSTVNNDMLMWSHYGASHSGFCLIYRPVNGYLHQCPIRYKNSLLVTQGHSCIIGKKFKVEKITYNNKLESIDAFTLFPTYHTGYSFNSEEERLNYHDKIHTQLLTKNECWHYEDENRLLLPQPNRWVSGEITYSSFQRLFHYDFNQVVGIIFGARMKESEKITIKEILNNKLEKRTENFSSKSKQKYIFDFLYQQAEICSSSRVVNILDQDIFSMGSLLKPGSDYYNGQLEKWKTFQGITVESGNFSYDEIP